MIPLILILAAIAGVLWWRGRHPYVVTREEMKDALVRVLERKMPDEDWHSLVHRRIGRDRYLDSLREKLVVIPRKSRVEADRALYAPAEMAKVSLLLDPDGSLMEFISYESHRPKEKNA